MSPIRKRRIIVFDGLKLFAIFLVLWGHSIQQLFSFPSQEEPLFRIIYSFHMPLFMIMSGFFSASVIKDSFPNLLKKKSISLIIPAITGALIFIVLNNNDLRGGARSLWYLKSLFLCIVFYYIFFKFLSFGSWTMRLLLSLAISQIIPSGLLSDLFPFFMGGVCLKKYYEEFLKHAVTIIIISGILWFIMISFYCEDFWFLKDILHGQYSSKFISGPPIFVYSVMRLYKFIIGFAGASFFIAMFILLEKSIESNMRLVHICEYGKDTLGVYIIQTFILEMLLPRLFSLDEVNRIVAVWLICPIISMLVLFVILQLIKIIDKSKISSLLILGRISKNN